MESLFQNCKECRKSNYQWPVLAGYRLTWKVRTVKEDQCCWDIMECSFCSQRKMAYASVRVGYQTKLQLSMIVLYLLK